MEFIYKSRWDNFENRRTQRYKWRNIHATSIKILYKTKILQSKVKQEAGIYIFLVETKINKNK